MAEPITALTQLVLAQILLQRYLERYNLEPIAGTPTPDKHPELYRIVDEYLNG
jgi:hypothetical protein